MDFKSQITNITDINFRTTYEIVDLEYYSPRTNDNSKSGHGYWEKTADGYQLECEFSLSDPDYIHKFAIDNYGVWVGIGASSGRGTFGFIASDTILSENLKSDSTTIIGRIFNVPKTLQNHFNATVSLKRIKKKTYVEKITINATKEVCDLWFERYCKYRVQTSSRA